MKYIIGGTSIIDFLNQDQLIASCKSATDSTLASAVSAAEARGGQGNKLYGRYFHNSKLTLKLEDALINMQYIGMNLGKDLIIGGDAMKMEGVTITNGKGTVKGTPISFSNFGIIGWVSEPNKNNWQKVTFTGQTFDSPFGENVSKVTVKYIINSTSSRQLQISSNIIPKTVHVIMHVQLFAAQDADNIADSTKIGEMQIDIPRFEFDGNETISLTSNGVAKASLNGTALSVDSLTTEDESFYGTFKEVLDSANWYDYVDDLAIADDEISLSSTDTTTTLQVMALPLNAVPFKPPYSDLTFSSDTVGTCSIDATGKITRAAAGKATITVSITEKPSVQAIAQVTAV